MISRLVVYSAVIGVLLMGITALALYTTDDVEQQFSMEASEVFNTWVFREVSYEVGGDQLTLTGQLIDQDLIDRAVRQAQMIVGRDKVTNLLSVKPSLDDLPDDTTMPDGTPIEEIYFIVQKRHNMIYLGGLIQSKIEHDFIRDNLSEFILVDKLEIKPLPKRWNKKLFHLTRIIKKFERATLNIQGRAVHMHGTVKLGERIDLINAYMRRLFPRSIIKSDLVFESLDANASECQQSMDLLLKEQPKLFMDNQSEWLTLDDALFDKIAQSMLACDSQTFEIISPELNNKDLNLERAQAIQAILVNKGVDPSKLSVNKKSRIHVYELTPSPQLTINVN